MSVLKLENLSYTYHGEQKKVLDELNYDFENGKIYCIMGKSGAGKTTLLSLLSGLTTPTDGKIFFNEQDISHIDKYDYRNRMVGVIFQGYNLLPHLTAEENVQLSMDISGKIFPDKVHHGFKALSKVELGEEKATRRILKLSGGEQQRVAIARALSYDPEIILADEPTGNLDGETQEGIINIFKKLAHEENKCVIIVTHSPEVAKAADVLYELTSVS
ncbi:ABC transporter ATP-binding protein [Acetobacterium sp.]|uniref:ABC transporter ATP-binding protein n=1 Tax=Acetobacterium sp. TaxID=1872094 RepID=UPI002F411954